MKGTYIETDEGTIAGFVISDNKISKVVEEAGENPAYNDKYSLEISSSLANQALTSKSDIFISESDREIRKTTINKGIIKNELFYVSGQTTTEEGAYAKGALEISDKIKISTPSSNVVTSYTNGAIGCYTYDNGEISGYGVLKISANLRLDGSIDGNAMGTNGIASTSGYGLTKLSTSTSSTSTALAATSSAVKTAYDKAKSAFSGKGLPWAVFSIIDEVNYTAWSEQAPSLTLRSSYSGDRTSTFSHGGAFYIYCPYAGRVEINFNLYVGNVSSNGYLYARCYGYQYASDGSKELLDFTGMGAVTSSGSQANGTLVAEVKAGKYIYIVFCSSVSGKTNASSNTTDYKVRLQYRNIYD